MTEATDGPEQAAGALASSYSPREVEARWASRWAEQPFKADPESDREPYTIVIPPPNITGSLHLGHAFDNTLIDTIIRFRRLQGYETLYQPGTDHAGIATQLQVERELKEQGLNRLELGREEFIRRVWDWKDRYGEVIVRQLHRLGISADWSRSRFTLDEQLSRAVRLQFIRLYHAGKIYRAERIVNWDPSSQTTLSDLEVNREERKAKMFTLAYELEDGGHVHIATVRPETIFADTAVAVHPDDERYAHLIGRQVRIPLTDRLIPVIADEAVERDFGTGALKITPAHDPTDFGIGERHGLPRPSVIGFDARLKGELVPEEFRGLDRFEARPRVVDALEAAGALVEVKDHTVSLGLSERTGEPVEPMVSLQWFYDTSEAAAKALESLERGEMRIHPERYRKVNADWLKNLRPWNISRQLWWGHRIPAWYDAEGNTYVPDPEAPDLDPTDDSRFAGIELTRDPDVFDTWFSSNLWPFSTLGWPDEDDPFYRKFYPTSTLVTGYDILFFWVARMQLAAFEFTGQAPFRDVMLHGLILDSEGQKMSKSRGNGVDPLEAIDAFGADALRFALCHMSTGGQDINWDDRRVEMGRNFANKLWNATRFVLMNLESGRSYELPPRSQLSLADRWILDRLNDAAARVTGHLEAFELGQAARAAYEFVWSEFCDWYLEAVKPALKEADSAAPAVLHHVTVEVLRLLHPFMPFITSELFEALGFRERQLGEDRWISVDPELRDPDAVREFGLLMDTTAAIRNLRAEAGLDPRQTVNVHVQGSGSGTLLAAAPVVSALARAELSGAAPAGPALQQPVGTVELHLPLSGLVDLSSWSARQRKRLADLQREAERLERKLSNEGFLTKAKPEVVAKERERLEESRSLIGRLEASLEQVSGG